MTADSEKLDKILQKLESIQKKLKIVTDPNRETTITDFVSSVESYQKFALADMKLEKITIRNHKSAILSFLKFSKGIINKQTVQEYLDSKESESWKSNQIKALRRYIRDFLRLGTWIQDFQFSAKKDSLKQDIPNNEQLAQFCLALDDFQIQLAFLILLNSGLREGEVLSLTYGDIDFEKNGIDARRAHNGKTKSSWYSFMTQQTVNCLNDWISSDAFEEELNEDTKLFDISPRTIQQKFKDTSEQTGIFINPHLLRTIFAERCREAGIEKEYIKVFQGRKPKGILESNYTVYGPQALKRQYDKVEDMLILELPEVITLD